MRFKFARCSCSRPAVRYDADEDPVAAVTTNHKGLKAASTPSAFDENGLDSSASTWAKLNRASSLDKRSSLSSPGSLIGSNALGSEGFAPVDSNRILKRSRSCKSIVSRSGSAKTRSSDGSGGSDNPITNPSSLLEASALRLANSHSSSDASVSNNSNGSPAANTTSAVGGNDAAARCFGDLFVQALMRRNVKWASETELFVLLHDNAKLITHDKQVFQGKTAIIRRLNAGMEQFVKMIEKHLPAAEDLQRVVDTGSASIDVQPSDGGSKHAGRHFTVTYTFKLGVRRFKFWDEMSIKDGQVKKLKRHRG